MLWTTGLSLWNEEYGRPQKKKPPGGGFFEQRERGA
jgi:hypothetical protein